MRRSSGGGCGYLLLGIALILVLLIITGVLTVQINAALHLPAGMKLPEVELPDLSNFPIAIGPFPTPNLPGISVPNISIGLAPTVAPGASAPIGQRTKTIGCASQNALPDRACTPGAVFQNVTKEQICTPGYSTSVRDVPDAEKNQVYAEYGVTSHPAGQYEVDHLVPLELGGSNDIANLWPQLASPAPGFHEKDQVENYLHDQMCSGAISLQQAQSEIATNWLAVYQQMPK